MQLPVKIDSFIPHDGDMSLLDEVVSHTGIETVAVVSIDDGSLFFEEQGVPSWLGIEYMGQVIAAHAGLLARAKQEPVKIGFLVSTRRYEPGLSHFPPGVTLRVSAKAVTEGELGLQVFECSILGPGVDCRANLNVFMPEDADKFMRESSV